MSIKVPFKEIVLLNIETINYLKHVYREKKRKWKFILKKKHSCEKMTYYFQLYQKYIKL